MELIDSEHFETFNSLLCLTEMNCTSSPLVRSKRTAEIIWGDREEVILTDSELREIDLYSFQVSSVHFFFLFEMD